MKKTACVSALIGFLVVGCDAGRTGPMHALDEQVASDVSEIRGSRPAGLAHEFMQLAGDRVRKEGISPPVASRFYAYVALALYEGARVQSTTWSSLRDALRDAPSLPAPRGAERKDGALVAAAAAYAAITSLSEAAETESEAWALVVAADAEAASRGIRARAREGSIDFGWELGGAIVSWADADGFRERSRPFVAPTGPSHWRDARSSAPPVEPYWGELRGFGAFDREACRCPAPPDYSTNPSSQFYKDARVVYDTSRTRTAAQEATARYWADSPRETTTPPGHWMQIAGGEARARRLPLEATSLAYAAVTLAVADAFIHGWREKYAYNLLRPDTYITENIDATWSPLLPTPRFPEYVSGHSVGSAAAARVLSALFGEHTPFEDRTHEGRFGIRRYTNFDAAAREAAVSRLYGGIHFPFGNEEGLRLGTCVGEQLVRVLEGL